MEDGNSAAELIRDQEQMANDHSAYMDDALESVVETVMLFGVYPQPSAFQNRQSRRIQFDLITWIADNIDGLTTAKFMAASLDYSAEFDTLRFKTDEMIRLVLMEEFRDSEIVQEKAAEMLREAREDH